jgi:hypothetical protein
MAVHVRARRGCAEGRAMVQKVHLGKPSPAMEGRFRKCGQDIK